MTNTNDTAVTGSDTVTIKGMTYSVPWERNKAGLKVPGYGGAHNPKCNQNQFTREIMHLNPEAPMAQVCDEIVKTLPLKNDAPNMGYARVYYRWGVNDEGCPGTIEKIARPKAEKPAKPQKIVNKLAEAPRVSDEEKAKIKEDNKAKLAKILAKGKKSDEPSAPKGEGEVAA